MIESTRALARRWLNSLLHVNDSPERTARAYALGVFLGFSPFLGLHTIIAVVLAFALNLNRVAVLLGVYSNLPWIMGGYYAATTVLGAALTRASLPPDLSDRIAALDRLSVFSNAFWQEVGRLLMPFLWPYTIGSTIGALLLAAIAYRVALEFVIQRRRHHHPDRHQPTS